MGLILLAGGTIPALISYKSEQNNSREIKIEPITAAHTTAITEPPTSSNSSLSLAEEEGGENHHNVEVVHSAYYSSNSIGCATMSLQLDRYGFIVNIDNNGQIVETNGVESIQVPSFAESQQTERREKKWNATLHSWEVNKRKKKHQSRKSSSSLAAPKINAKKLPLVQRKIRNAPSSNKILIRRLRKGVPDSIRGRVWVALGGGIQTPGRYQEIVQITSDAMLENCREIQNCNNDSNLDSSPFSNDNAATNTYDGDHNTPERASNFDDNNSNSTSPTSVSEVSSSRATTPPPTILSRRQTSPITTNRNGKNTTEENYATTRNFRSIQDIIERDIHRTYPRHDYFYEEERVTPPLKEESSDGESQNFLGTVLCDPGSEIAAMILNLEADIRMVASGENSPSIAAADSGINSALQQYSVNDNSNNTNKKCATNTTTQSGQAALRRVLRAYSYYDPEVGYCQGMNFIAGMFLTQMSEEEAFWLLVSVMNNDLCKMRGLFGEGMRDTHKVLFVAEKLIHHYLPRIERHFEKEHIHLTMYATQWLLTQYTSSFKFDLVFRVWDSLLGEGWKIVYRIMLALLQKHQSQLTKMTFEEILTFFREMPNGGDVDGNQIMDIALKIPLRKKVIAKYEKDWDMQHDKKIEG